MEARLNHAIDLRGFLEGPWEIARSIEDRLQNAPGRLTGRAVFSPNEDGLLYRESGRLILSSFDDLVHQDYLFQFPEQHRATVSFKDGRPFHDLDLRSGVWQTRHLCDPDVYEGQFTVEDDHVWQSIWIVKGPRKDMTISTRFLRSSA